MHIFDQTDNFVDRATRSCEQLTSSDSLTSWIDIGDKPQNAIFKINQSLPFFTDPIQKYYPGSIQLYSMFLYSIDCTV